MLIKKLFNSFFVLFFIFIVSQIQSENTLDN